MKNAIVLIGLMLLAIDLTHGQVKRGDVVGLWLSEEKNGKVEIFEKEDGTFAGRTRWLLSPRGEANPPTKDVKNPDITKRNRPVVGLEIMYGFEFKNGQWVNGKIYDPRSGKTYQAKMKLKAGDSNTLLFRGYVGIPLLGRTTTWTRVCGQEN